MHENFTTEELAAEIWLPIIGYGSHYSVSNIGRIMRTAPVGSVIGQRIITPIMNGCGYLHFRPSVFGVRTDIKIHLAVAYTFIGQRPDGFDINHRDGVKTNNRVVNLEYVTRLENCRHAVGLGMYHFGDKNGTHTHPESVARGDRHSSKTHPERVPRGEAAGGAVLTEAEVCQIRTMYQSGNLQREIAALFGVTQTAISCIIRRTTWRHVP